MSKRKEIPRTAQESATRLRPLAGYARRTKQQGETETEALARACSERPDLYEHYDAARRAEAQRNEVQAHLEPKPEPLLELSDFGHEQAHLLDEIAHEAHQHDPKMTASEYAMGVGRNSRAVKTYDEMTRRGCRRSVAERSLT